MTNHESWGGKREGSGRKPIFELSERERSEVIEDVRAKAAEHNTSFGKQLGEMMFGKGGDKRTRLQSMRLFATNILATSSERDVNIKEVLKPQVFVPEKYPDSDEAPDFVPRNVETPSRLSN